MGLLYFFCQIAFSIFIVLWAIVMLEFWKRKEKLTALYWGMIDFEKDEISRPGAQCDVTDVIRYHDHNLYTCLVLHLY
jgi:hypothetical protein